MNWKETDPERPKDWRYQRAEERADAGRTHTRRDDTTVRRTIRFLAGLNQLNVPDPGRRDVSVRRDELYSRYRDIAGAYEIYAKASFARYAVEALVMAREPADEIADSLSRAPEVIHAYEEIFFDVRSRLDHDLWVKDELLAPAIMNGMAGRDYDFFWKYLAISDGQPILHELMWSLTGASESVTTQVQEIIASQVHRNALSTVVSAQFNSFTAPQVFSDYVEILKLEANKGSSGVLRAMEEGALLLQNAIDITVAPVRERGALAREPRVDEVLKRLAAGGVTAK